MQFKNLYKSSLKIIQDNLKVAKSVAKIMGENVNEDDINDVVSEYVENLNFQQLKYLAYEYLLETQLYLIKHEMVKSKKFETTKKEFNV